MENVTQLVSTATQQLQDRQTAEAYESAAKAEKAYRSLAFEERYKHKEPLHTALAIQFEAAMDIGKFLEAATVGVENCKLFPKKALYFLWMAKSLRKLHRYEDSKEYAQYAMDIEPNSSAAARVLLQTLNTDLKLKQERNVVVSDDVRKLELLSIEELRKEHLPNGPSLPLSRTGSSASLAATPRDANGQRSPRRTANAKEAIPDAISAAEESKPSPTTPSGAAAGGEVQSSVLTSLVSSVNAIEEQLPAVIREYLFALPLLLPLIAYVLHHFIFGSAITTCVLFAFVVLVHNYDRKLEAPIAFVGVPLSVFTTFSLVVAYTG